jgi:exonuclease VII small subunit
MERVMIEKNTIKSQDSLIDCNNGKRSSETLIQTISKLETTIEELERTKKQLEIAVKALTTYSQSNSTIVVFRNIDGWNVQTEIYEKCSEIADKALKQIEDLNEIHKQE